MTHTPSTPANPAQVTDAMVDAGHNGLEEWRRLYVSKDEVRAILTAAIGAGNEPFQLVEESDEVGTQMVVASAIGAGGQAVEPKRSFEETFSAEKVVLDHFFSDTHPAPSGQAVAVKLTYTNYRGETAQRTVTPKRIWFGSTEWHTEPQWLLTAYDHDKQADRDFALRDFGTAATAHPVQPGWRKPRLTESMMRAACKAHFGTENIDGVCVTVKDADWTFREAFKRMWRGALSAAPQPKGE